MRPRLSPLLLSAAISPLVLGCGPDAPNTTPSAQTSASVATPSWAEQIAAVRAGTAKRIIYEGPLDAENLAQLADGCDALEILDLARFEAGEDTLRLIGQLPHLQRLKLGGPIDDAGVEQLVAARQLEVLNLPEAAFSDRGLQMLCELPHLELLRFHSPHVTDAGMAEVSRMPALRFLHLIDVPITDAGLQQLHGMQQLESFYLDGGRCTQAGMRDLLRALPELHFHLDQLHLPDDPQADGHSAPEPSLP